MYITIDIGGTNTRVASFKTLDIKSEVGYEKSPTNQNYKKGFENIKNIIAELAGAEKIDSVCISIASGISDEGKTIVNPNIPEWKAENLVPALHSAFQADIKMINDGAAGGLAEAYIGVGENLSSFTFLTWGTGLGGATIKKSGATLDIYEYEPGHLCINGDGRKCKCGKTDCIESYVGGLAVEERLGKKMSTLSNDEWSEVLDFMRAGLNRILGKYPVANIVFDGRVIIEHPDFVKKLESAVNDDYPAWVNFEQSLAGEKAPLYGALIALNEDLNLSFHKNF